MWVRKSGESGAGGGFIDRISLRLLKNIDFNDYSHIYPCKIFFLCCSFFWLISPHIKS